MNKLASIRMFATVAQSLSFAEAARLLNVSNSVVTRGIADLEQELDARLFNRTTRHVSLTPVGKQYFDYAVDLLQLLDTMDNCVAEATNQTAGSLRLCASASFAATDLPDLLAGFRQRQPRVNFELSVFDSFADVDATAFDLCFSAEKRSRESALIREAIASTTDVIVASPRYLDGRDALNLPEDLSRHDVLVAADAPSRYWDFKDRHGTQRVVVRPIMNMQSPMVVKRAVLSGLGIARLPHSIVRAELATGELVEVLPDAELCGAEWTIWLLHPARARMSWAVARFVEFVQARYRKPLMEQEHSKDASGHDALAPLKHHGSSTELLWSGIL